MRRMLEDVGVVSAFIAGCILILGIASGSARGSVSMEKKDIACTMFDLNERAEKAGEFPVWRGITAYGWAATVVQSPDGSAWSVLISSPKGKTCMIASGKDAIQIKPPLFQKGVGLLH